MIERNLSDRYRLEGRIGQGGMAIVYSGVDTVLRRRVAIKVLREALAADEEFVSRFYTEAQHAAKLSHPNVVNIYDVGREGDAYFIVMELIDGATLGEMIENDGPLPEPVAIDFGAQICNGLAYAHRQGLLHRDVKPANILVTKDDVVKLSDFGIARAVTTQTMTMTQPGLVMGSVFYISPEQAQGHELHATSDLYSLGVVLYQMLSGKLPYTGESPITVALRHVSSPVPALETVDASISPALAAIVRKLMQKDPRDRFQSATEVARALREAREHPSVTTLFDVAASRSAAAGAVFRPRAIPNPKPRPSKYPDRPVSSKNEGDPVAVEDVRAGSDRVLAIVFVAILALIGAVAAGYYFTDRPGGLFGGPKSVAVAGVVGERVDEAQRKLLGLGLQYKVVPVASLSVASHRVLKQEPGSTAHVPPGSVITLYVSSGAPTVALIDIRHYSSDDAQRYLRNVNLVPKITEVYDAAAKGTVLSQKPAPGSAVAVRSSVALSISKGPRPIDVPDLVSLRLADARAAVASRKLQLVVTGRDPSDEIPPDVITSQSPQAGTQLNRNGTVSVIVSSGPPQISVPDLGGKVANVATAILAGLGMQPVVEYVVDPSAPIGTVLKQTPDRTVPAKKGATVTLAIAVPGTVPDVAGKSPSDAQTLLQNAGYKIGNTAYVQEGTEGTVVRTEPAVAASLRPGETVMLYVSGTPTEPQ